MPHYNPSIIVIILGEFCPTSCFLNTQHLSLNILIQLYKLMHQQQYKFDHVITSSYLTAVQKQIKSINDQKDNEARCQFYRGLKDLDRRFIADQKMDCTLHLMTTRHGQSTVATEKKFGFKPNAPLSQNALNLMKKIHEYTSCLLSFPNNTTYVGVSPMVRAKQTASLLLPKKGNLYITLEPALTENSVYPSGMSLMSPEQAQEEYQKVSFFEAPLSKIVFKSSLLFYFSQKMYDDVREVSGEADEYLLSLTLNKELYHSKGKYEAVKGFHRYDSEINKQEKFNQILNFITDIKQRECDCWLFGHSANFSNFFKKIFGINLKFDYCQTRSIYRICSSSQSFLISTPYRVSINQITGMIEARFSPQNLKIRTV